MEKPHRPTPITIPARMPICGISPLMPFQPDYRLTRNALDSPLSSIYQHPIEAPNQESPPEREIVKMCDQRSGCFPRSARVGGFVTGTEDDEEYDDGSEEDEDSDYEDYCNILSQFMQPPSNSFANFQRADENEPEQEERKEEEEEEDGEELALVGNECENSTCRSDKWMSVLGFAMEYPEGFEPKTSLESLPQKSSARFRFSNLHGFSMTSLLAPLSTKTQKTIKIEHITHDEARGPSPESQRTPNPEPQGNQQEPASSPTPKFSNSQRSSNSSDVTNTTFNPRSATSAAITTPSTASHHSVRQSSEVNLETSIDTQLSDRPSSFPERSKKIEVPFKLVTQPQLCQSAIEVRRGFSLPRPQILTSRKGLSPQQNSFTVSRAREDEFWRREITESDISFPSYTITTDPGSEITMIRPGWYQSLDGGPAVWIDRDLLQYSPRTPRTPPKCPNTSSVNSQPSGVSPSNVQSDMLYSPSPASEKAIVGARVASALQDNNRPQSRWSSNSDEQESSNDRHPLPRWTQKFRSSVSTSIERSGSSPDVQRAPVKSNNPGLTSFNKKGHSSESVHAHKIRGNMKNTGIRTQSQSAITQSNHYTPLRTPNKNDKKSTNVFQKIIPNREKRLAKKYEKQREKALAAARERRKQMIRVVHDPVEKALIHASDREKQTKAPERMKVMEHREHLLSQQPQGDRI